MIADSKYDEWQIVYTRILKRISRDGDCILWTGAKNNAGYGQIRFEGRLQVVHKLIYRFQRLGMAKLPKNQFLHHSCGNKTCLNDAHMYITSSRR